MNESNLEYLKKSLDYLGFGTKLNEVVETAIRREIPKFSVGISSHFEPPVRLGLDSAHKDTVHFTLDFNKAKESDTYYLNDYTAQLKTHNGVERKQEFNLERDHRITASQAYRLLLGAALQKEVVKRGEQENAPAEKTDVWYKLNLDVIDSYGRHPVAKLYPSYGFDLSDTLDKYPFVWQKENEKTELMAALKKGTLPKAAMEVGGRIHLVLVSANPRMKNLDVFDSQMNPIKNDRILPDMASRNTPQRVELTGESQQSGNDQEHTGGISSTQEPSESNEQTRSRGR